MATIDEALIEFLDSPKFLAAQTNTTRLVAKLKTAAQNKEFYESQQILRTIYFRFINSADKIPALADLLYQGSCYLLKFQEFVSAQDIATLFLEAAAKRLQAHQGSSDQDARKQLETSDLTYHREEQTLPFDLCSKVSKLTVCLPDTEVGQPKFVAEALRILSPKLLNRHLLHHVMAKEFWQHGDLVNARFHYLHCANIDNAQDVARLLIEYHHNFHNSNQNEVDLFITQFILQFLCLQRPTDAQPTSGDSRRPQSQNPVTVSPKSTGRIQDIVEKIFSTYTKEHPTLSRDSMPYTNFPLLNFIHFIMRLLGNKQEANTFKTLCRVYRASWSRDPKYENYLNRIGTLYFGIVDPSKQQQGGFFNNILMSLLDGTDDDDNQEPETSDQGSSGTGTRSTNANMSVCDELD